MLLKRKKNEKARYLQTVSQEKGREAADVLAWQLIVNL